MRLERRDLGVIAALVALKIAAMLWALHCGFAQVSDDDYARTVIAQTFAHAPKLDPSGTSWLPFPFWLYGAAMMLVGRSLSTAKGIAFVLGALAPAAPYAGLRSMQMTRTSAFAGAALASLTPWSVWLGLAPVPEGWAGACAAAALFFLAGERAMIAAMLALVASLSRYETWPVAAFVAAVCVWRARRDRATLVAAAAGISGIVFWVVNNALTHGDALHFVARVAAFRRTSGPTLTLAERVVEYPLALVHDAPEIAVFAVVAAGVASRDRELRARWVLPLAGAACVLAFLVYGDLRDGAPTHHAARALLPIFAVLAGFAADAIVTPSRARVAIPIAIATLAFVLYRARAVPGASPSERRDTQIARGRELSKSAATALDVTPCAYEHFALIAAYGAPERVTIERKTGEPVTRECPSVVAR